MISWFKKNGLGLLLCLAIAVPSWFLGKLFPIIGGAVIAILIGMLITVFWKDKKAFDAGIKFTSKKILQWAVILLGFGLNLSVILQTGKESLPIIICTITTSLVVAWLVSKLMKIDSTTATLIGVGSSICGGSAIAATAPVVDANDEEVAQAISVIFFFNVLAALIFPAFGKLVGFAPDGNGFGIFAGTAVNDTSSVTAAASTWDSMWNLGSETLDKAVTVKLTRTLAIIPITLVLALVRARKEKKALAETNASAETTETTENTSKTGGFSFKKVFPMFIIYFVLASVITTLCYKFISPEWKIGSFAVLKGVKEVFGFFKTLSKFFIVMAMAAIGLNTNVVKLIKTGGKPLALGACCWVGITAVCLLMQLGLHQLGPKTLPLSDNAAVEEVVTEVAE